MKDRIDLEIYNQLVRYLAKDISLREFRDWFDTSTWDLQEMGAPQDAWEVAGEIELRLSELSSGHWTEDELRDRLTSLASVLWYPAASIPRYWHISASASATAAAPGPTWDLAHAGM